MRTITLAIASLVLVVGCASKPSTGNAGAKPSRATTKPAAAAPKTSAASSARNVDPCAMRLHDLCAPLLMYYAQNQSLPRKAEELAQVPGFDVPAIVCPVTNKPYLYNPHGPSGPDPGSQIILYDAAPHDGRRWGIAVHEPTPGQALIAKVVVVPESIFTRPPAP